MDSLNLHPSDRTKSPLLKKCFAILRLDESSTYAILDRICDACNTEMSSTHRLLKCKKSSNVRDSFMNKIYTRLPYFNTLSKEDKLRILNLSCENHVINDVIKYTKTICTIHCFI